MTWSVLSQAMLEFFLQNAFSSFAPKCRSTFNHRKQIRELLEKPLIKIYPAIRIKRTIAGHLSRQITFMKDNDALLDIALSIAFKILMPVAAISLKVY